MKIACDFCDAKAYGTRDSLQMAGWVLFSAPKRITITACPKHHPEWSERVNEVLLIPDIKRRIFAGVPISTIAKDLKVSRATIYRRLAERKESKREEATETTEGVSC